MVDDYGRIEADPALLRVKCFPRRLDIWTVERTEGALLEISTCLTSAGIPIVSLWEANSRKYLQINGFNQRIRSAASKCPSPDGHMTVICQSSARLARASSTSTSTSVSVEGESEEGVDPKTGFVQSLKGGLDDLAEKLYSAHPKAKDWPLLAGALLRALQRVGPDELLFTHRLWTKTEAWREKNGQYCPSLPKWLDDRGYDMVPDEFDGEFREWQRRQNGNQNTTKQSLTR